MNKKVEELISEIERLAHRHADDAKVAAIADEVRAHLDASVQARLELGATYVEAEREATQAFGDAREFVRQLTALSSRPNVWQGVGLGALVAICAVMFSAPTNTLNDGPYEWWTGVALLVACSVAAVQAWRMARVSLRNLLLGVALSIPLALTVLSAMYVAFPEDNNLMARRDLILLDKFNIANWRRQQVTNLNALVTTKTNEIQNGAPPYSLPRSTIATSTAITTNSRVEALALLNAYKVKVEASWPTSLHVLQESRKQDQQILNRSLFLNAYYLWLQSWSRFLYLWIIVITCQLLGVLAKCVVGQRVRAPLLLSSVLEIGLDESAKTLDGRLHSSLLHRPPKSSWYEFRVFWVLLAAIIATATALPLDPAGNITYLLLGVSSLAMILSSWHVRRPQFLPLLAGFVIGVPTYVSSFWVGGVMGGYRSPSLWADGLFVSMLVVSCLGAFHVVTWFVCSISRRMRISRKARAGF